MMKKTLLLVPMLLVGCSSNQTEKMNELQRYVAHQKVTQKANELPPLPQVEQYSIDSLDLQKLRNPFMTPAQLRLMGNAQESQNEAQSNEFMPDFTRQKTEAEMLPLSTMRYVGVIQQGNGFWGIVRSNANGETYRVRVGDYLGQDFGRVVFIDNEKLIVDERVLSVNGIWTPRETILKMQD